MPRVTIDGQEIEVEAGTTVLQAAEKLGVFIPHYCYHDGLSIAGNCRICLVEVEKMPKLTTGCTQPVADGMVIHTRSDKVKEAQGYVMEYLLKNHPLDCPICDQSGECLLQDYYMEYDRKDSRLGEPKNRKAKAKVVGPRIVLDQERCIMCTRCVRFLKEVTHTGELGVFGRGSKEILDIAEGHPVDNDYDVNIVDLCPVGALTDKDYRFRVRSWYLQSKASVCDGCATGCNVLVDYNLKKPYKNEGRRIVRYRARHNDDVNGHWICNHGRYTYHKHEDDRLLEPMAGAGSSWPTEIEAALEKVSDHLAAGKGTGEVGIIAAPGISNEDALLVREMLVTGLATPHVDHRIPGLHHPPTPDETPFDGLLRRRDPWPNTRGLAAIGLVPGDGGKDVQGMLEAAAAGEITTLVVIGVDLTASSVDRDLLTRALANATSIALVAHRSEMLDLVDVAIPIPTHVEMEGTFTNHADRVQHFAAIVPPMGSARPLGDLLSRVGQKTGLDVADVTPREVFTRLAAEGGPFQGLSHELLEVKAPVKPAGSQWTNDLIVPQL